jgi:hypothetical protein
MSGYRTGTVVGEPSFIAMLCCIISTLQLAVIISLSIWDSLLSDSAALAFEYRCCLATSPGLVILEAQFGVKFEVLTAVKMSMLVFWVVTSYGLVDIQAYQSFGGTCCIYLQGW